MIQFYAEQKEATAIGVIAFCRFKKSPVSLEFDVPQRIIILRKNEPYIETSQDLAEMEKYDYYTRITFDELIEESKQYKNVLKEKLAELPNIKKGILRYASTLDPTLRTENGKDLTILFVVAANEATK